MSTETDRPGRMTRIDEFGHFGGALMKRHFSRTIVLMLAVAMLVGAFGSALAAGATGSPGATAGNPAFAGGSKRIDGFTDINNHWARDSISFAIENNIMNGMTDTEFWPNYSMTRAMLVTVLWRIETKPPCSTPATFTDVPAGLWYSEAVAWASENNIVQGRGDNTFDPMTPISRQDFCVILYRFAIKTGRDERSWKPSIVFTDYEDISLYARDAVNWCSEHGIVSGRPNGEFDPSGNATRAEGCHMLRLFLEKK